MSFYRSNNFQDKNKKKVKKGKDLIGEGSGAAPTD